MKNYKILLFILSLCIGSSLQAQNRSEAKTRVVVVEKEINNDGEVTKEKMVLEGEEAEKYLKEHGELEGDIDIDISLDGLETIDITADDSGIRKYKIVTKENGNTRVMEWDGEGEMPAELEEALDQYDINIEEIGDQKTITMRSRTEGLEPMVRKKVKKGNTEYIFEGDNTFVFDDASERARLGVVVDQRDGVVWVDEVMEGSPAEKAGIASGDHIIKVDDTEIDNIDRLLAEMGTLRKGQEIPVIIKVNGEKEKKVKVKL